MIQELTILDLLDDASRSTAWVEFRGQSSERLQFEDLWRQSFLVANWLSQRTTAGQTIALVLTSSKDALSLLFGSWIAGLQVASLPDPARVATTAYAAFLEAVHSEVSPELFFLPPAARERLRSCLSFDLASPSEPFLSSRPGRSAGGGSLLQFTSGSTSLAAGVRLTLPNIAANVDAILERLRGDAETPIVCSWLPLSHDMGLVGGCLAPIVAGAESASGGSGTCLLEPSYFARRPSAWLATCSEAKATVTLATPSSLALATKFVGRQRTRLDLSHLESCVIGAEHIPAETLAEFVHSFDSAGFAPRALKPSYGLAENTVAVTIPRPDSGLPVHSFPGTVGPISTTVRPRTMVVGCGPPVRGTEVRIIASSSSSEIGEIAIRGTSLFSGYAGGREERRLDGWFLTGDIGAIVEGDLYPMGRLDDMIVARGENLLPTELEAVALAAAGGVARAAAAVPDGDSYAIVIELGNRAATGLLVQNIRSDCAKRFGIAPARVVAVARRSLPRTASGKLKRPDIKWRLAEGELDLVANE